MTVQRHDQPHPHIERTFTAVRETQIDDLSDAEIDVALAACLSRVPGQLARTVLRGPRALPGVQPD